MILFFENKQNSFKITDSCIFRKRTGRIGFLPNYVHGEQGMFLFLGHKVSLKDVSICRVIKAIYALYMLVHTNDMVISQSNCIANNKKPPSHNLTRPSQDAFRPFGLISRACPVITKNQNPIFAII